MMTYISWSKGFKSGGFNAQARKPDSLELEEETVTAYDVEFNSDLLDGRVRLNGAIYYATYEDRQLSQFVDEIFVTSNAAEVASEGIEIPPAAMTRLRFSLPGPLRNSCTQDLSGKTVEHAPGQKLTAENVLVNGANVPLRSGAQFGNYAIDRTVQLQFNYNIF